MSVTVRLTDDIDVSLGDRWRGCDVVRSLPPPSPPPDDDGDRTAARLGWGAVIDGDKFGGTALDPMKWFSYYSPGHNGKGLRRPAQITVGGGNLTITGRTDGTTGGMEMTTGRQFGRWEASMQVPRRRRPQPSRPDPVARRRGLPCGRRGRLRRPPPLRRRSTSSCTTAPAAARPTPPRPST